VNIEYQFVGLGHCISDAKKPHVRKERFSLKHITERQQKQPSLFGSMSAAVAGLVPVCAVTVTLPVAFTRRRRAAAITVSEVADCHTVNHCLCICAVKIKRHVGHADMA